MSLQINLGGVNVEATLLDQDSILLEGLDELVDRFFEVAVEGDAPPDSVLVGSVERNLVEDYQGQVLRLSNYVRLRWAKDRRWDKNMTEFVGPVMTLANLQACTWTNNLDTLRPCA
jgi:hypothetical protein